MFVIIKAKISLTKVRNSILGKKGNLQTRYNHGSDQTYSETFNIFDSMAILAPTSKINKNKVFIGLFLKVLRKPIIQLELKSTTIAEAAKDFPSVSPKR